MFTGGRVPEGSPGQKLQPMMAHSVARCKHSEPNDKLWALTLMLAFGDDFTKSRLLPAFSSCKGGK
jgi:hypothetical protein